MPNFLLRRVWPLLAALLVFNLTDRTRVEAQTCPPGGNDACDQWHFERADGELAAAVAAALRQIDTYAHPDTRQEAKDRLQDAQRSWVQLRAADCASRTAFMWLRSSRTREGNTSTGMYRLTVARIAELKRDYLLGN
jgi:uncharacterized protein YecT (DUF1311 family)